MKPILRMLVLVLAAMSTLPAHSQMKFGLKGGTTVSSFSHGQPHTGTKVGYTAGVFGAYSFSDLLGVQVEAAYFQQGGTWIRFKDDTRFGANADFFTKNVTSSAITLHNLEVPVLMRLTVPVETEVKPVFFAGPSIGFNLHATERYERTGELAEGVFVTAGGSKVVTSQYNLYQVGATAGLGLEIPMGSVNLLVDARYRYGINPVLNTFSYVEYNGVASKLYSNSFAFTLGLGF
jgi:hypothetical protein